MTGGQTMKRYPRRSVGWGAVLMLSAVLCPPASRGDEETVRRLFEGAIAAMGGDAYLGVKDMVSEGRYFQFDRYGNSSGLIRFTDYTRLPDKSRFELGNRKKELEVTVFNLEKGEGWILEGQKETRAATAEEMQEFRAAANHSLDNIFRFRYRDPGNKLFYLGAGEGKDARLEMVKMIDPENDETVIYFDRVSRLPVKLEAHRRDGRGVRERLTSEYSQWHVIQGVNTPLRIDGYTGSRRAFQQFITRITYNNDLLEEVFSRPEPPK